MDGEVRAALVSSVASAVITWAMLADRAHRHRGTARWWIVPSVISTVFATLLATLIASLEVTIPFATQPLSYAALGVAVVSAVAYFAAPALPLAAESSSKRKRSAQVGDSERERGRERRASVQPTLDTETVAAEPGPPDGPGAVSTLIDVMMDPLQGGSESVAADTSETLLTLVDEVVDVGLLERGQR